jgi:hypothetical protein
MTSLQSRPIAGRPWNYQFYADLEGHPLDASVSAALRELEEHVAELSYLGCYPASDRPSGVTLALRERSREAGASPARSRRCEGVRPASP